MIQLSDRTSNLKYVSDKYQSLLENLGIFTVKDLLTYFPYKYLDASDASKISEMIFSEDFKKDFLLKVKVEQFKNLFIRGGRSIQEAIVYDGSGQIKCSWFNQPFLKNVIVPEKEYLFFGRMVKKGERYVFFARIYEEIIEDKENIHLGRIVPEYSLTKGISKKWLRNRIKYLIDNINLVEIPDEVSSEKEILDNLANLLKEIHFPTSKEQLAIAVQKLSLIELTEIQLKLIEKRKALAEYKPYSYSKVKVKQTFELFKKVIGFELTSDQIRIIESISKKLTENVLVNDLIQGDVGSGKTILAVFLALLTSKAGYQTAILSPTTILAKQHFKTFESYLSKFDIEIELVTSENKKTVTKDVLIGTSAILARKSDLIKKLALIIVDEQHRFGVEQREDLLKPFTDILNKKNFPHFINMTATPIPRTIVQAFFGDLEVFTINTKPIGRLPIKTYIVEEDKRKDSYKWIEKQITEQGDQVYWICPLVNESEKLQAKSAEETYKQLQKVYPKLKLGLLHGQMKEAAKAEIMNDFITKKIDLLVATSVIEVGVDVSNAAIMVIENAERFGLAQLHQIRGRVGRGIKQSWCFLFYSEEVSEDSHNRLKFLSENNDGLKIAEFDLQNRGPGEIYGTRQSGIPSLKIAKLNNIEIIKQSRIIAERLYNKGITGITLFK